MVLLRGERVSDAPGGPALLARLAEEMLSSPDAMFRLADEVGEILSTGPLRERVRMSLASVLATRMEMHGRAVAALDSARDALAERWRIERGGDLGAPTPTRDLVGIVATLGSEVARGEDLVLRTSRTILEEVRAKTAAGIAPVPREGRYSGSGEGIPLPPPSSTPEERESLRILTARIAKDASHFREVLLRSFEVLDDDGALRAVERSATVREVDAARGGDPGGDPALDI